MHARASLTGTRRRWWWWLIFYDHFCAQWAERPPTVMKRSQRWNSLQLFPRWDSNSGGSDLWSNALPTRPRRRPSTRRHKYFLICINRKKINIIIIITIIIISSSSSSSILGSDQLKNSQSFYYTFLSKLEPTHLKVNVLLHLVQI